MSRTVPAWQGSTDNARAPARVRARIFAAQEGKCAHCGKAMARCGEPFDLDHITPLILGGANAEGNLQALCGPCHTLKSKADVAQKSTEARKRAKHLGIERKKAKLPGSRGSNLKRRIDGTVVRRDG